MLIFKSIGMVYHSSYLDLYCFSQKYFSILHVQVFHLFVQNILSIVVVLFY